MFLRPLFIISISLLVSANCAPNDDAAGSGIAERLTEASEGGGDGSPHSTASLALIERGQALYERRCGACHSLDANRVGPKHRNVYGRAAGAVSDYRYSKALQELDVIWTEETLDPWLENPAAFAPGTAMGFRLSKAEERTAIIAYLKSVSGN